MKCTGADEKTTHQFELLALPPVGEGGSPAALVGQTLECHIEVLGAECQIIFLFFPKFNFLPLERETHTNKYKLAREWVT